MYVCMYVCMYDRRNPNFDDALLGCACVLSKHIRLGHHQYPAGSTVSIYSVSEGKELIRSYSKFTMTPFFQAEPPP